MSETLRERRVRRIRHKGRGSQVGIYLGKQMRFFINQSDWKVLPMAAVIAALVSMVIRNDFFITMEGNLKAAFALTCVAIWNGCFNSIQAVCRERPIVKREHRSGMHISSYVLAHMIYQFLLCAAQTGLSIYVMTQMGVSFPGSGVITNWMIVDIALTILLISYAADMMSLLISSISHTTTGAMTVMPFVLIFQLVFSGGLIPLPGWSKPLSNYTISNYGIKALASQSGYNEVPMVTAWNTLDKMRNNEIGGSITLGELTDLLSNPALSERKDMEVLPSYTVGEVADILNEAEPILHLRNKLVVTELNVRTLLESLRAEEALSGLLNRELIPASETEPAVTLGSIIDTVLSSEELQEFLEKPVTRDIPLGEVLDALHVQEAVEQQKDTVINKAVTLGDIVGFVQNNEVLQSQRDRVFSFKTTVGELIGLFGEENVKNLVQERTAMASRNSAYERTPENVLDNWLMLGVFIALFAFLSMISLELIDHDKR